MTGIIPIVNDIATYSIVLPALVALWRYFYFPIKYKFLAFYLVISSLIAMFLAYTNHHQINNLLVQNIYDVFEFSSISIFFFLLLFRNLFKKSTNIILIGLYIIGYAFANLYFNSFNELKIYTWGVSNGIIVLLILLFLLSKMKSGLFRLSTDVLVSLSLLLYFAGTLILFLSISILDIQDMQLINSLWSINDVLCLITNLSIALILWKIKSPQ
jgi:hypothetical protein